ncbi:hypothetical protein BH09ACT8_BH09ACT8_55440 [soil metagenome]
MLNTTASIDSAGSRGSEPEPPKTRMGSTNGMTDPEREAIVNALERLSALEIDTEAWVYVDDENRLPSYALHVGTAWGGQRLDDEELDYAIGWLPEEAFLNDDSPWPGSYNPYITVDHLRQIGGLK